MSTKLAGQATLFDNDSDDFIEFSVHKYGQVNVKGQIGGSHNTHFIRFDFLCDQTCLEPFAQDIKKLENVC
jgi:hypothetical protein